MVRHTVWNSNFGKMILQVFKIIWERWPKFNHVSKCTDPSDVRTVSFCMWNFVWKNKAQLALFRQTKFHIQKSNTCRSIEKPSRGICYLTMVQHSCRSTRVYTPTKFSTCSYLGTVRYTHSLGAPSVCTPCVHRRSGAPAGTATKLPQLTDSYRFIYKISEWRIAGVSQEVMMWMSLNLHKWIDYFIHNLASKRQINSELRQE